ncbi:TolC family protein [Moheibacter lacus]|uniref:TolC family protein n=1 Tax=Moheibacter lacus TaxID=2745851 RepID=A0A838ZP99_9FLAO|nr:TolC family protein [Moheibacter lacus]MBA5629217.1 TolC family protein [Moheibacter lacus]
MKKILFVPIFICFISLSAQEKWSLEACVNHATENNLTIIQNRINEEISENDLQYANNQWLPTANGYFDNSLTLGTNHPSIDKGYQQYTNSLGINSQITIYNGGLLNLNKEKANLVVDSYQFQTETAINDISLLVINYYLNIVLNRELLMIAEGNLAVTEQQLDRSQKLFDNGRIARADLVQAEANVAQDKKTVADAKIEVDRALFNLSVLLQLPDYREFDIETVNISDDIKMGLYDLNQVLATAYAEQPAVKKAEVDLETAGKDIEIAKTGFLPTITGSYNFGTSYADYFNKGLVADAWLSQWHDNLTNVFGVQVNIPIFEKFNNKLNVQKAQISESLAQNNLEQQKQTIRENVQEAYFNANASSIAFETAKESVRSSEISADFAQRSFDAGVLNIYDLNIARNNLVVAQSQMAQAKYNFIFRMKVLDFYAGIPLTEGL